MGKCIECGTKFVGTPESPQSDSLCKYCEIEALKDRVQLLQQIIKDHTRQWVKCKEWRAVAEQLAEYSNPRTTKGVEYAATMQRLHELRLNN